MKITFTIASTVTTICNINNNNNNNNSKPVSDNSETISVVMEGLVGATAVRLSIYLDDVAKLNDCVNRKFIIVYADDILLIA